MTWVSDSFCPIVWEVLKRFDLQKCWGAFHTFFSVGKAFLISFTSDVDMKPPEREAITAGVDLELATFAKFQYGVWMLGGHKLMFLWSVF